MEEWQERQEAELEFVQSAYSQEEAWCEGNSENAAGSLVHRRLDLAEGIQICLTCRLPPGYPITSKLEVSSVNLEKATGSNALQKVALDSLPNLLSACREVATVEDAEEAIFLVFSRADEWIQDDWPEFKKNAVENNDSQQPQLQKSPPTSQATTQYLGRHLIYSHHIISKIKRADIKKLASDFQLTGYMKVGWPGLLIIEGAEQDCLDFYDEIRRWRWQYVVVRGQQQVAVKTTTTPLDGHRKFKQFLEVDDMSVVAQHCREVGLESLFRTSMKVYNNDADDGDAETIEESYASPLWYGALIHVDHMNDSKGYCKWLIKTSHETDCLLVIQKFYPNDDYTNRPKILVAIGGGGQENVSAFMKRWRTSRVDVDSKGKPCLERKMTMLLEGNLDTIHPSSWENCSCEENATDSKANVAATLERLGGVEWRETVDRI